MNQRGKTVAVGAALVIVLSLLVGQAPVPYVALLPGPTYDTLGVDDDNQQIIVIDGTTTSDSAGQLRFLTVNLVDELTLLQAVTAWISGDEAVVPREIYFPPDKTTEEVSEQNQRLFVDSVPAAQEAALRYLGYPSVVAVKEVAADSPNAHLLKAGDVVRAVDGTPTPTPDALLAAIQAKPAGSTLRMELTRDGAAVSVEVTTVAGDDGKPRVGFLPEVRSSAPFTISIPLAEQQKIGGPSAGLMLALGIVDKLDPQDLTGGRIIAGTGQIDAEGNVGAIGGVPQKIVAAKAAGATIFLTPADNCDEAVANVRPGLLLVRVETLDTALAALKTLREGGTPPLCPGAPTS